MRDYIHASLLAQVLTDEDKIQWIESLLEEDPDTLAWLQALLGA